MPDKRRRGGREERSFTPRGQTVSLFDRGGVESSKGRNKGHQVVASGLSFCASWGQRSAQECRVNARLGAGSKVKPPSPVLDEHVGVNANCTLCVRPESGGHTVPTAAAGSGLKV